MKHNPIRMQYDALLEMQKEISEPDLEYLIGYVWAGFDDLTHDGYSVVDYDTELNFDWGDVLQHSELDELREVVKDRYNLTLWGRTDNANESLEYLKKLADAVDDLYDRVGPFYCRFGDGDAELDVTPLEREDQGFTYEMDAK